MRLLLTSGGIKNEELRAALFELAGAPASELSLAFVPTAANIRDEDKSWLIDDLLSFRALGLRKLDIVDVSSLTREQSLERLEQAQIIVFGGGNTEYLLQCLSDKGLVNGLLNLLEMRTLIGISAGSVMCCPVINPRNVPGLGLVKFMFVPHMGAAFSTRTRVDIEKFASLSGLQTYWVDDNSGLLISGNEVRPVGSGIELVTVS